MVLKTAISHYLGEVVLVIDIDQSIHRMYCSKST